MTSQAQQLEMVLETLQQVDVDGLHTVERTVQRLLQQRTAAQTGREQEPRTLEDFHQRYRTDPRFIVGSLDIGGQSAGYTSRRRQNADLRTDEPKVVGVRVLVDVNVFIDRAHATRINWAGGLQVLHLVPKFSQLEGWTSALTELAAVFLTTPGIPGSASAPGCANRQCAGLHLVPLTQEVLTQAAASTLPDFEDNIQLASAEMVGAEYLITRNTKDFHPSPPRVLTPKLRLRWNRKQRYTKTSHSLRLKMTQSEATERTVKRGAYGQWMKPDQTCESRGAGHVSRYRPFGAVFALSAL